MNRKELFNFLRLAITGRVDGPDIIKTMRLLGVDECISRIERFLEFTIKNNRGKK
jgi:glutamyl/glutaminyl-tRNA synthetase